MQLRHAVLIALDVVVWHLSLFSFSWKWLYYLVDFKVKCKKENYMHLAIKNMENKVEERLRK